MKTGMLTRAVRRMCCTEKLSIVGGGPPPFPRPAPPVAVNWHAAEVLDVSEARLPVFVLAAALQLALECPGRSRPEGLGRSVAASGPGVAPCANGSAPASGPRRPASAQPHDCFIHCPIQLGEKRAGPRCPPELLAFLPGRIAIADPDSQRPPRPSHMPGYARPARLLPCYLSDRIPGSIWNGLGKGGRTGTGVPRRGVRCVCEDATVPSAYLPRYLVMCTAQPGL
jgi:hypothetical protein